MYLRSTVAEPSPQKDNRSLAEPVHGEKFLGESHAKHSNVFEKHNQVATTKLPSETELYNRSNINTQKYNYIINGAVVSSVLFALIGGVIAKDAAIGTIAAAVFGSAAVGASWELWLFVVLHKFVRK
ncbi:MAG: hypothetical protein PG981_000291 [Wolbachia endosymbiont of Ctenocephalides orientis wCori]|nr:MAG: hypothetical protein PG981_000291 [Wolbachia endosymbiont of Ctenocephalides orientis wCori]